LDSWATGPSCRDGDGASSDEVPVTTDRHSSDPPARQMPNFGYRNPGRWLGFHSSVLDLRLPSSRVSSFLKAGARSLPSFVKSYRPAEPVSSTGRFQLPPIM